MRRHSQEENVMEPFTVISDYAATGEGRTVSIKHLAWLCHGRRRRLKPIQIFCYGW